MFRIRLVPDDSTPANASSVKQVQAILREQFPDLGAEEVGALPAKLRDPIGLRFRPILLVAEDADDRVRGFALLLHASDVGFSYLDFIAAGSAGGGVGGALYDRVREEAAALGSLGIFLECLPDDPALSPNPVVRKQNCERLAFYERFAAYPLAGTSYETPVNPGDTDPPYLVFDGLGAKGLPAVDTMQQVVRAILERKYAESCPPEYVDRVVGSFASEGVGLREPRYHPRPRRRAVRLDRRGPGHITLVVNDRHDIHHVRERGYVEAPARVASILREIEPTGLFEKIAPTRYADRHILAVHDGRLVDYLQRACAAVGNSRSVYPYVFPVRNAARPPQELPLRAGYFCIDTFTPINANAWLAARRSVDCTLTCAEHVLEGQRFAYALVRPPGHHAERRVFGGFCYLNNAAIAANYLSRYGRVAVLDVDYHHGNGTQDIFYERADVMTVSIHGRPRFAYPYFSGFADERGSGAGAGCNLNIPLAEHVTPEHYRDALDRALRAIDRFGPRFLVLAAGFDTAAGDPTGSWSNRGADFEEIGLRIGARGWPTLVVQEGGYRVRTLGANVRRFFEGLSKGGQQAAREPPRRRREGSAPPPPSGEVTWREEVVAEDVERVRSLVAAAGVFSTDECAIAADLVRERLALGPSVGYEFVLGERDGRLLGYACFGPIPGAGRRFDLYWIAVDPAGRRIGLGRELMARTEQAVKTAGGAWLWIDTSGRDAYAPAWRLYRRCGYRKVAELPDFFAEGDAKIIFSKQLAA